MTPRPKNPAHTLDAWRSARAAAGCPARVEAVRVPLEDAAGLVTAAPVRAVRASPPFDAAGMDGIAVRAADTASASETTAVLLAPGAFDVVDTGDPVPDGRDAVVMREYVRYVGTAAELSAAVSPGQHVRPVGEDVGTAELLLPEGHPLRAVDLAAAAAAGSTHVLVRRAPVVAVLPIRTETHRPAGRPADHGRILGACALMLAAKAREAGCRASSQPIEPDDPGRLAEAITAAAAGCDLLIIVTEASADRDDAAAGVAAQLGAMAGPRMAAQPGHGVVLGVVEATPVLVAPAYPVPAALIFDTFAKPLLAELQGATPGPDR